MELLKDRVLAIRAYLQVLVSMAHLDTSLHGWKACKAWINKQHWLCIGGALTDYNLSPIASPDENKRASSPNWQMHKALVMACSLNRLLQGSSRFHYLLIQGWCSWAGRASAYMIHPSIAHMSHQGTPIYWSTPAASHNQVTSWYTAKSYQHPVQQEDQPFNENPLSILKYHASIAATPPSPFKTTATLTQQNPNYSSIWKSTNFT